jgi:ATP-dependent DNA helicase RecG
VYAAIREELSTGGRVYIVCPLVSESSSDALAGVKAAEEEYARLVKGRVFDGHGCGLLHGKMKQEEKEAALAKFNRYAVILHIVQTRGLL